MINRFAKLMAAGALCAGLTLSPITALATPNVTEIRQVLEQGQYGVAADRGERLGTVQGYIVAAEALSAEILIGQARKPKKQAKRAMKMAEQALDLDPGNTEAKIQYALAYGFMTRETGDTKAWMKKLPVKCRDAIDTAITAAPGDGRAVALLASWHTGIWIKGSNYANKLYGADSAEAVRLYEKAVALSPEDWIITANYITTMAGLDAVGNAAEIDRQITTLMTRPTTNAVEAVYKIRMRELSNLSTPKARQTRAIEWLEGEP